MLAGKHLDNEITQTRSVIHAFMTKRGIPVEKGELRQLAGHVRAKLLKRNPITYVTHGIPFEYALFSGDRDESRATRLLSGLFDCDTMPRPNHAKQWIPDAYGQEMIDKITKYVLVTEKCAAHLRSIDFADVQRLWAQVLAEFHDDPSSIHVWWRKTQI
jgi:hypothetical protein